MVNVDDKIPSYLDKPMQALAYWIGYEKSRYGGYKLTELPLVAEFARLVHASLNDARCVRCEVPYKNLFRKGASSKIMNQRADLCILERVSRTPVCVIEAKLFNSCKKRREDDLLRLLSLKKEKKEVRTFLLVFSEGEIPVEYMNANKTGASAKRFPLDQDWCYKVRRIVKASECLTDSKLKNGHYVCLLEIVQKEGKK